MPDEPLLVVVRVRANPRMSEANRYTLKLLRLPTPNAAVLMRSTPEKRAMIRKVAALVTWGEVQAETVELLRKKAGDEKAKSFRLNPPRGGYGRRGVKAPFVRSGALGDRGDKINDLIKRMVS